VDGTGNKSCQFPCHVMRTVESIGATLETREEKSFKAGDVPTISSNIEALSILHAGDVFLLQFFQCLCGRQFSTRNTTLDLPTLIV